MSWAERLFDYVTMRRDTENKMAKKSNKESTVKKIKFEKSGIAGDAKEPAHTPWGASLRNVLPIVCQNGDTGTIRFGLSVTDTACIVWPHRNLIESGLQMPRHVLIYPGQEIAVEVINQSGRDVSIPESTMLLNVAFLPGVEF